MIRLAKISDKERISELLYQVHEVHAQLRPDLFKAGRQKFTDKELELRLADRSNPVFVYTDEKNYVEGYVFCEVQEIRNHSSLEDRTILFIDDLCVDRKQRGKQIGEKLYRYVLDYARSIDCDSITLHVWNENSGALRFYERLGMTAQYTNMAKFPK